MNLIFGAIFLLAASGGASATSAGLSRRLPQALIVGAKKAGTRALLAFSKLHPAVIAAGPEAHFFDRHYSQGLDWYRNRMPPSLPHQLTMEKTPAYFVDPKVPSRVRAMNPDIRLVLLLRDPVDRALSDYAQAAANAARRGRSPPPPFERLAFVRRGGNLTVNSAWSPLHVGCYAEHLSRWLAEFPRRQILVLSAERLVRDPGAVMARLQHFLGIPVLVTRRQFYWDRRKGFHCVKELPARLKGRRRRKHCLASAKGRQHPAVSRDRLRDLRRYFRPYNRQLYRMVGENLSWDLE